MEMELRLWALAVVVLNAEGLGGRRILRRSLVGGGPDEFGFRFEEGCKCRELLVPTNGMSCGKRARGPEGRWVVWKM